MFAWMRNHKWITGLTIFFGLGMIGQLIEPKGPSVHNVQTDAEDLAALEKLIAGGVFSKYGQGEVWIGPTWHALDFDHKQNACRWAYDVICVDGSYRMPNLEVKDNMNGKTIGNYAYRKLQLK